MSRQRLISQASARPARQRWWKVTALELPSKLRMIWSNLDLFAVFLPLPPFILVWASKCIDRRLSIRPDSLPCDKKCNFLITENMETPEESKFYRRFKFSSTCNFCWMWGLLISVRGSRYKETSQSSHSISVTVFGSRPWEAACSEFILARVVLISVVFISFSF